MSDDFRFRLSLLVPDMLGVDLTLGRFWLYRWLRGGHWEFWALKSPWRFRWHRVPYCFAGGEHGDTYKELPAMDCYCRQMCEEPYANVVVRANAEAAEHRGKP